MALTILFTPKSFTVAKYEEVLKRLQKAGMGSPSGRLFHSCYGPKDALRVVDVWASQEQFDKFGKVLMPIMAEVGVDAGTPDIQPQHNSITGK
ncbi:MAG TPA: hypothetical protein VEI06_00025 [Gemmatimonadaceae bacterium]|nr:hypothetical protein [Gemmatimonadaceae bacterium]